MECIIKNGMNFSLIKNNRSFLLYLFIGFSMGCKTETKYIDIYAADNAWQSASTSNMFGADLNYLDAKVINNKNDFVLMGAFDIKYIEADGKLGKWIGLNYQVNNYLPVIGNNEIAYANNIYSGKNDLLLYLNEYYTLYLNSVNNMLGQRLLHYNNINSQTEVVAINADDRIMVSLSSTLDSTKIFLALMNINYGRTELDTLTIDTLYLPSDAGTQVIKMKALQKNFILSSASQTYMITPDGNANKIFNSPLKDVLVHNGACYAEIGKNIYRSDDDGLHWNLLIEDTKYPSKRTFASAANQLYFFKEDSLFLVNPLDFSYSSINNKGFKGNSVVKVCYFIDNIYVVTNNGLFFKPKLKVIP